MKPNTTVYIGDGVYLHFDGSGFELRANDADNPTDVIYLEESVARNLYNKIEETFL